MRHLARRVTHAASTLALASLPNVSSAQAAAAAPPRFVGSPGQYADFEITRDTTLAHTGHASIRIRGNEEPAGFANVSAVLPAPPYVGHRVRFSAFLRSSSLGGQGGQLWARADDANHKNLGFVNSQATVFRGTTDWTQLAISLDVPPTATQIYFGVISLGPGSLWIDDARLEADGGATPFEFDFEDPAQFVAPPPRAALARVREAPRALSPRGLANVSAFTSALGYVRFFHPSPEAVRVNWDAFAVHGMRAIEKATTPDSLASALGALFAPTVRFARTGTPIPTTIAKPVDATHVVFWQHVGIGSPSGGMPANANPVYQSQRVIVPLAEVGLPLPTPLPQALAVVSRPHVPDPSRPVSVTLDGGVTMSVPVALYTADTSVLDSLRTSRPAAVAERFTANDRATRLADVALAWSLFEHFYPYFDVVHTDWPAARAVALRAAATDSSADQFDATLERLVAALHDGHGHVSRATRVLAPPDVQLTSAEGRVIVIGVGDSSAARGVRLGDELVAIDGRDVANALADKSSRSSGATPQWVRTRAVNELLVGDIGSVVQARFRGADGTTRDVRLMRNATSPSAAQRVEKIAEVSPGVTYMDLGRITDADFAAALPQLERARAIIFDMRGYPRQVNTPEIFRHLTDSTIHSAHFEAPVITMPDFRDVGYLDGAWNVAPAAPRLSARVVFLSGGGAISYAESTLGIVEAYRLGDIVGEASAGTNGNVNPFMLPGGYTIAWTGMLVQKRDGTPHHGVGIRPTVPASPTVAGLRAGRDEVLERAIALVTRPLTP
jgi:hypothetical protein